MFTFPLFCHWLNSSSCFTHQQMTVVQYSQTAASATAEIARDVHVGAHSLSVECNASPVYNLRPLNSPTHYLRSTYLSLLVFISSPSLHSSIPHLFSRWNWKKDRWDMLWCPGAQNIGLSNRKLRSALKCTLWSPVPDRRADRRTDRQTNIMTIARRFVLTNASRGKNRFPRKCFLRWRYGQ